MKNKETVFVCSNCGNEFSKWAGQCSACGEWNSLKEVKSLGKAISARGGSRTIDRNKGIRKVSEIETKNESFTNIISTEIKEFDRVLGKGIVQGSVTLFAGEPGIGKSTLLTQLVGKIGGLYIAGEESAEQIALRVKRLGLNAQGFDIFESNSVEEIEDYLNRVNNLYKIVVVDSIQVIGCDNATGTVGSVSQIKESTFRLVQLAKKLKVAMFIVGHVTKDGDIAGPKLLEHMVDTVLYFEGEKNGELRILRANKNRFGPTDEVGIFKMTDKGLLDVKSEDLNLVSDDVSKIGSAVTVLVEGTRPVMVEIQALVVESFAPMPKRVFAGVDFNRGQLLTAIAQKSLGMPLYKYDVFVSVTGGIKIDDTGADLAVLAAMWSSYKEKPLSFSASQSVSLSEKQNLSVSDKSETSPLKKGRSLNLPVYVGEVSLLGEVRKVKFWEKRKKEAEAMGKRLVEIRNVREIK
jgi:DNA repair protein RadA/Sms